MNKANQNDVLVVPKKKNIRKLCDAFDSTRKELAEAMEVPYSQLGGILYDKKKKYCQMKYIQKISDFMDVSLDEVCYKETALTRRQLNEQTVWSSKARKRATASIKKTAAKKAEARKTTNKQVDTAYKKVVDDTKEGTFTARVTAIIADLEDLRDTGGNEEKASAKYRELVAQFSKKALTHSEALTLLREIVDKAAKFDKFKNSSLANMFSEIFC